MSTAGVGVCEYRVQDTVSLACTWYMSRITGVPGMVRRTSVNASGMVHVHVIAVVLM